MECWKLQTGETPPEDRPFALVVDGPHGQLVHAVTLATRKASIRPTQRVTDARAICPNLILQPHCEVAAGRALSRLAECSGRWSPLASTSGSDGLLLDLTGGAHLWGGEAGTMRAMIDAFASLGHSARIAIAPTVGAAWALARHGGRRRMRVDADKTEARLAPLPAESLRLDPTTVLLLGRLGLKTVGALSAVPRTPLARRFTATEPSFNPLIRLDQATGRLHEPVSPHISTPPVRVVRRVTEPVTHVSMVEALLDDMVPALVRDLENRGHGLRRALLQAYRVDGGVERMEVETARPTRDVLHVRRLFDGRLEHFDAGFGFDAFALTAVRAEPLSAAQPGLMGEESGELALARLIDRLVSKLGPAHVRRPVFVESHVPERSFRWVCALESTPSHLRPEAPPRPLRLLDRPERIDVLYATPEGAPRRFTWRRRAHLIAKVEGPERIAPEWWRARPGARERDYYRVEDADGRRYWLFRHGRFGDGAEGEPGWYLHGLFA